MYRLLLGAVLVTGGVAGVNLVAQTDQPHSGKGQCAAGCQARGEAGISFVAQQEGQPKGGEGKGKGGFGKGGFGGTGGGFRPPQSPVIVALDTNKDGELSADEIKGAVKALKSLDKDGDGKLSAEELRPEGRGFGGGFGGPGAPGGGGFGGGNLAERLKSYDKNEDGKLSKDELPEFMQERFFERADANSDGVIDQKEIEQMTERFGQGGGGRPGFGRGPGGDGGPGGPGGGPGGKGGPGGPGGSGRPKRPDA